MDPNQKFKEEDGDRLFDAGKYRLLVEQLIYLSLTWPDIAFDVSITS